MSVDYYSCDACGESCYEEYVGHCSKCGHNLCTDCLVNKDIESDYANDYNVRCNGTPEQQEEYGFDEGDYKIDEIIDDSGIDSKYCPFCNGTKVNNDDLLDYIVKKYKIDIESIKHEFIETKIKE